MSSIGDISIKVSRLGGGFNQKLGGGKIFNDYEMRKRRTYESS